MADFVSLESVARAKAIIAKQFDGSETNRQVRQAAAEHLFEAAKELEIFASKQPDTDVARHCRVEAETLRSIAWTAYNPGVKK